VAPKLMKGMAAMSLVAEGDGYNGSEERVFVFNPSHYRNFTPANYLRLTPQIVHADGDVPID
jgi:hypothetical protein